MSTTCQDHYLYVAMQPALFTQLALRTSSCNLSNLAVNDLRPERPVNLARTQCAFLHVYVFLRAPPERLTSWTISCIISGSSLYHCFISLASFCMMFVWCFISVVSCFNIVVSCWLPLFPSSVWHCNVRQWVSYILSGI